MNDNFNYGNNNNSNKNKFIILILIIIVVAVAGFIYFKVVKTDNKENSNSNTNINQNQQNNNSSDIFFDSSNNSNNQNTSTSTEYDKDNSFLMAIEDVFTITGRGTVVTGRIERGTINLNDTVQVIGLKNEIQTTTITGIEMFRQNLDTATAGDNVGLLLKGIERQDVERGQVLAKPNTITNITKFDADVYVLTKEEGGRQTPFFNEYRPQFYFRTTDITGTVTLPSGTEMVSPGDNVKMTVELVSPVALEVGTEFSIREGGRTVGKGTITRIYK